MAVITSLDGGIVEIGGDGVPVELGATRFAVYESSSDQHEFALGNLSYGEWIASDEGVELTEEYTLPSGRQVRVGRQAAEDPVTKLVESAVLGVWYCSLWSMTLWLDEADSAQVITMFNEFTMDETETGVVLSPRVPEHLSLVRGSAHAPEVVTYLNGIGSIEVVQHSVEQNWRIPSTHGRRVAGGELWAEDAEDPDNVSLLLVNDSAITRVYPEEGPEAELIDRCSRLQVGWTPAKAS